MKTKRTVYISVLILLFTFHRGIALADENVTKERPKPLLPKVRSNELRRPTLGPVISAPLEKSAPVERPPEKANVKTPWESQKVTLYSPAGELTLVDAKRAMVEFNGMFENAVVVFVNPKTGNVWAAREADFYFETDRGIIGGWLGGSLQWYESLIQKMKQGEKLDDLVNRFVSQIETRKIFQDSEQATDFRSVVRDDFLSAFEHSSAFAPAKLKKFQIKDGTVRLDLESNWGLKASVWISLETRKINKAVEDGKQTFPKQDAK